MEELSAREGFKQAPFLLRLGFLLVQFVLDPGLEHLLVADSGLDGISSGTPFLPPARDERNVVGPPCVAASLAERSWRPK